MTTYIVASTYRRYLWWCQDKGLNPRGPEVRYVTDVRTLMGVRNIEYVCLEGWTDRPDWREIYDRLLIVGRTATP